MKRAEADSWHDHKIWHIITEIDMNWEDLLTHRKDLVSLVACLHRDAQTASSSIWSLKEPKKQFSMSILFSRGLLLLNGCVYTLYIIVVYEQVHLYNTLQTSSGANEKENDTWCIFPYSLWRIWESKITKYLGNAHTKERLFCSFNLSWFIWSMISQGNLFYYKRHHSF